MVKQDTENNSYYVSFKVPKEMMLGHTDSKESVLSEVIKAARYDNSKHNTDMTEKTRFPHRPTQVFKDAKHIPINLARVNLDPEEASSGLAKITVLPGDVAQQSMNRRATHINPDQICPNNIDALYLPINPKIRHNLLNTADKKTDSGGKQFYEVIIPPELKQAAGSHHSPHSDEEDSGKHDFGRIKF